MDRSLYWLISEISDLRVASARAHGELVPAALVADYLTFLRAELGL